MPKSYTESKSSRSQPVRTHPDEESKLLKGELLLLRQNVVAQLDQGVVESPGEVPDGGGHEGALAEDLEHGAEGGADQLALGVHRRKGGLGKGDCCAMYNRF